MISTLNKVCNKKLTQLSGLHCIYRPAVNYVCMHINIQKISVSLCNDDDDIIINKIKGEKERFRKAILPHYVGNVYASLQWSKSNKGWGAVTVAQGQHNTHTHTLNIYIVARHRRLLPHL